MYIYKTTNKVNGKIYIGKSLTENESYLGSGKKFKEAFKEFGRDNFSKEILEGNIDDPDYLNEREKYWIEYYNSTDPEIGYNLQRGGGKTCFGENHFMYGKHVSESVKTKISISNKTRPVAESTKRKQSESLKGRVFSESTRKKFSEWQRGRKISEETKKKLSIINTGKKHTEEAKKKMSESQKKRFKEVGVTKRNGSSIYYGVYYRKDTNKWRVTIRIDGKTICGGSFFTEEEAALKYNELAVIYFGAEAKLNIINNQQN